MALQNVKIKAFTLVELIIVIAVIGIMTSVGMVSFQTSRNTHKVEAAANEVAATIKLAQSYALQGKAADDGSGNMVTPCGYGFRFDPGDSNLQQYEIFYNVPDAGSSCADMDGAYFRQFNTSYSQPIESPLTLTNGVTLQSPAISDDSNPTEIYFTVPRADMFGYDGNALASDPITLGVTGDSATRIVTINYGGAVTQVQN